MRLKKFFILFIIILVALGVYYRDYIPTTRSDVEGLYYYFTKKTTPSVGSELNPKPENSIGLSLNSEPTSEAQPTDPEGSADNTNTNINKTDPEKKPTSLPETFNNYVPFTSQAPTGVWDPFHDEACEEASLAMAHYYLDKRDVVFSKEAEKDIQYIGSKMKSGGMEDLPVVDVKAAAENLYGYKDWKIIDKPNVQDIENKLAQGNIIIIPLAGREIGNPYYRSPGPLYHMLVISGYDNKKGVFITQDPGTKRGKDFTYKFDTLLKANHDFPGDKNKIKEGAPKILVVTK